jgi:hypothetical protein
VLLADDGEALFEEVIAEAALAFGEPRRDLYLSDYADAADATADFMSAVAEGTRLMVFFGHGSSDLWSNRMVLSIDDVGTLDCGGGYPISLQFSCLTGDYASGWPSMATAMMLRPGDGVAAVVGSSGFSPSSDQAELARAMTGMLSGAAPMSIGQCLAEAKRRVGAARPSVVRTFNLLGDPAMK